MFCEVKTRRLDARGQSPFDAIRHRKRSQVRKMAGRWLCERTDRPYADVLRFDAIGVTFDPSAGCSGSSTSRARSDHASSPSCW